MNKTKRGVISAALVAAMIFSLVALASCGGGEDAETEIKYNIKITGSEIDEGFDGVVLEGLPGELTVLAATRKMCVDVLQVEFDYDAGIGAIKRIGPHISELFIHEYEEDEENEEGEEQQEEEDDDHVEIKDYYYDWTCTVNGSEAQPGDLIKDGDTVVWEFKQVRKETQD